MPWECKHSDEELIDAVVRLAGETGGTLTLYTFCDAVGVSPATINRRFGGWLKLRERAGLAAARSFSRVPVALRRVRMIAKLKQAVAKLGVELSLAEFCEHARVSSQTVQRLFGSWRQFRGAAGYRPKTPMHRLSWFQLLYELRRIHRLLGCFPTARDIQKYSRYPGRVFQKHFPNYDRMQGDYEAVQPYFFRDVLPGEEPLNVARREAQIENESRAGEPPVDAQG